MEETLSLQSERDFLRAVEENSQFLLTTFTQRHRRFDGKGSVGCLVPLLILALHGFETELESTRSPVQLTSKGVARTWPLIFLTLPPSLANRGD